MTDVIIIGGGPAGSAMGSYLSKKGISNIILEATHHPRPHVGESMVMSTIRIFDELGFLETLEREGFVHKYGASWHETRGRESTIRFADFPEDGIHQDYTYHVDRSRFDLLFLHHAQSLGSKVYQGVQVRQVLFDGDRATGVRVQLGDEDVDLHGKIVVDASGRNTLLGRQLNIKQNDPIFDQYAVHAWFEGVDRGGGETADYIHIYFLPAERGWAWQIPITDTITSIGIVTERAEFRKFKGQDSAFFSHYVNSNDALSAAMHRAVQSTPFRTEGDYSYSMEHFVGNGWMMVGDAARFVDPIFSSGVNIALYSGKFASEVIETVLPDGDVGRAALQPYEDRLRAGVAIWYEFIRMYYKLLPLFTLFIRSPEYRGDIHRLLQGEVYNRDDAPVLDAMRRYIETVERTSGHLLRGQLADIPIDDLPVP